MTVLHRGSGTTTFWHQRGRHAAARRLGPSVSACIGSVGFGTGTTRRCCPAAGVDE